MGAVTSAFFRRGSLPAKLSIDLLEARPVFTTPDGGEVQERGSNGHPEVFAPRMPRLVRDISPGLIRLIANDIGLSAIDFIAHR